MREVSLYHIYKFTKIRFEGCQNVEAGSEVYTEVDKVRAKLFLPSRSGVIVSDL